MSNSHGTVPRNPISAPRHPESHVVLRDIVHIGLRKLMASTTVLAFLSSSVHAQEGSALEEDRPVPICGTFETVEVNGRIINRRITENCEDEVVEHTGSSGGLGIVAGGLLVAGLAAAAGGSGGNDGSSGGGSGGNTPSIPRLHPRLSPLPPRLGDWGNPASWRTEEFNSQYGLGLIGVEHRYAESATGENTLGAIYDTGIDLGHRDVGGVRLDLSHNFDGRPDDLSDPRGHGTLVYGVAGATRNGFGIHGVAPDAQFMILKQAENRLLSSFVDAVRRVTDAGADAMNNSWVLRTPTGSFSPQELRDALGPNLIRELRNSAQAGVSVVFATGNDSLPDSYVMAGIPVALPELEGNWLAVTALNNVRDLQSANIDKADYANSCGNAMNWCLAAPGSNITVLKADGGTQRTSGTSLAAPHVTGAVLVLKSQFPELTTPEVHQILFDTAVDLGAPGVDNVFGHGALNLNEALTPQGQLTVELGPEVDQTTAPLSSSWIAESAITGGTLAEAMSDQRVLVTDSYDRGYLASLDSRVATGAFSVSPDMQAGLAAAFTLTRDPHRDLHGAGYDLRFDAFGPDHDVTRIAHADPVMALLSQTAGTGFSLRTPIGKATVSMASATATDGSAFSLGAGLPFGDDHTITVSVGRAQETDSLLGAKAHGAFGGLDSETVYGRVQGHVAIGERMTLNGSVTTGRTSFRGTGLLVAGQADTLAMALGLTFTDALAHEDKLSLALARPFAVSSGQMTLRGGTGISSAVSNQRTNRIDFAEASIPLKAADRAPELHLGYMHGFDAKGWADAQLAFAGIARLDGGAKVVAARVALTFRF